MQRRVGGPGPERLPPRQLSPTQGDPFCAPGARYLYLNLRFSDLAAAVPACSSWRAQRRFRALRRGARSFPATRSERPRVESRSPDDRRIRLPLLAAALLVERVARAVRTTIDGDVAPVAEDKITGHWIRLSGQEPAEACDRGSGRPRSPAAPICACCSRARAPRVQPGKGQIPGCGPGHRPCSERLRQE
jgi:hypothetical protein